MPDHPHVLVATLGGQPQIVTFTLDILLREGNPISDVIVVHPRAEAASRLSNSLLRLQAELNCGIYPGALHPIHFHSRVLELDNQPIDDIRDDTHADGTLNTLHRLLSSLKQQGYCIHLSVTGGRRMIGLLATSVASLNFDRNDHIWHLYTPESVREQASNGQMMHVPPEAGVTLIQGPFLFLGAHIPHPDQTFRSAREEKRIQMEAQDRARCAEVVKCATPAQLKVLRAFARGLQPQQVAKELCLTLSTVNTHKTVLLDYCRRFWNVPESQNLTYHFLAHPFGTYFSIDD